MKKRSSSEGPFEPDALGDPKKDWEVLIDILRLELQEYGALRNFLDQQHNCILNREIEELICVNRAIHNQIAANNNLRKEREAAALKLAEGTGLGEADITLRQLIAEVPLAPQQLLQSLVDELLRLTQRIDQKVAHNQILLSRASEITEQILRALVPTRVTKTYDKRGKVSMCAHQGGEQLDTSA